MHDFLAFGEWQRGEREADESVEAYAFAWCEFVNLFRGQFLRKPKATRRKR